MRGKTGDIFTTIRTEGALLPAEILRRIVEGDRKLEGLDPESYHLEKSEKINEAVNRAWFRCLGAWRTFRAAAEKLTDSDTGTTLTRERWLLILFQELGYGRLLAAKAQEIGGNTYPISHIWHHTPIHLVSFHQDMDRRTPGVAGAARLSPHSLIQEFLNRSENHLWGVVSNGYRLRILRDNISLTRQAYVDFDLEALMEGEIYPDFVLLYLLLHQSRLEADKPEECRLEKWSREAQERGTRALDRLRDGVEQAITALGQGFLAHPENTALRRALQTGTLSPLGYYQQLLRLIYRFIFLFVAEDRGLIPLSDISVDVRKRYAFYAIARLRHLAGRCRGTRHGDLYAGLRVTFACLEKGEPSLGIPALNGFLFSPESLTALNGCKLANDALLSAIRGLCYTEENHILRPVDYRNLGTEELGSVYESLLELHPELNAEAFTFALKTYAGSERKTTGSYYTHPSLIRCLLDSALEPLLDEAMKKADPEEAILSLKFVDPACGSGHFLIAAAHRIAKRLAVVRTGEGEPPLEALREALRDVVANCIYGVDINPLAVELCKVALWLESLDPRKPLGFLDHRIKCGNSIIGATPELLKEGIPDDAFKPVEGDDPAVASSIRRKNKEERKGQQDLFMIQEDRSDWREAASAYATWASLPEDNIKQVSEKVRQYDTLLGGRAIRHQHDLADLWTAAFFWPLTKETYDTVPTQDVFRRLRDGAYALAGKTAGRVKALADEHRFFHWHLEFPEVFMKRQGFDCVLGNPPWEKITTLEREFFSAIPEIVEEKRSDRRKALILALRDTDSVLYDRWIQQLRFDAAIMHFMRTGGRFPLSAVGELNLYPLFVELSEYLTRKSGTVGMIIKTGMMLSPTWADFSSYLLENDRIESAFDFRNWNGWFPDIGYHERFTLLTTKKGRQKQDIVLGYYLDDTAEIRDASKTFTIARDEAIRLNPITKTVPAFESSLHKNCVMAVYDRFPVLGDKASEWGVHYTTGLHMAAEADKLRDFEELSSEGFEPDEFLRMKRGERAFVPLYEGKFIHQFDHRFASFEGIPRKNRFGIKAGTHNPTKDQKKDPAYHITSRYWISEKDAASDRAARHLRGNWAIAFRDTTNVISNFRTSVACICSGVAFNYKAPNIMLEGPSEQKRAKNSLLFVALMNSFPFDFVVRQKFFGANFIKSILLQLAAPSMTVIQRHQSFILPRVLELSYTSWQLEGFAAECGFEGQPFIWDEIRRLQIRAELDALFFHIYGFSVDDAAFILDSYRILRDKDEDKFGEYRTKRLILEIYDAMQRAKDTGQSYQTHLSPSPGPPPTADGSFISMYRLDRANWPTHMHPPHPDWDESILNAWFDVCRGQWNYLEEHQVFPWVGRETFIYALIPYLIQEKPGAKFEFYRDAASLASCPERLETLLLEDNLRNEYRQLIFDIAWIRFPKDHLIRPRLIRETLQNKQIIQTTADSGITIIHGTCSLPPFPRELKPLLPLMLKAAVNLDKMQRHTLEDAEAAKMTFTQDEITNELKALSVA